MSRKSHSNEDRLTTSLGDDRIHPNNWLQGVVDVDSQVISQVRQCIWDKGFPFIPELKLDW